MSAPISKDDLGGYFLREDDASVWCLRFYMPEPSVTLERIWPRSTIGGAAEQVYGAVGSKLLEGFTRLRKE